MVSFRKPVMFIPFEKIALTMFMDQLITIVERFADEPFRLQESNNFYNIEN